MSILEAITDLSGCNPKRRDEFKKFSLRGILQIYTILKGRASELINRNDPILGETRNRK